MDIFIGEDSKRLLITTVQQYPVLYDRSLESYRCKADRYQAWDEVATKCGCPGRVDECKVIWKRLKDKYKQIKDRVARLDDEKSVPHWSLFDAMKFTDAYTNFSALNAAPTHLSVENGHSQRNDRILISKGSLTPTYVSSNTEPALEGSTGYATVTKRSAIKRKFLKDDSSIAQIRESLQRLENANNSRSHDCISLFYQSMAEEARRLPLSKRLHLQAQIFELTASALEDDEKRV